MRTLILMLSLPLLAMPVAARQSPPARTAEAIERQRLEAERVREAALSRELTGRWEEMRNRESLLSGQFREQLLMSQEAMREARLRAQLGMTNLQSELSGQLSGQRLVELQDRLRSTELLAAQGLEPLAYSELGRLGGLASLRPQQGTPEDSLYRQARETLNRGEYGRAAQLFQTFQERFPTAKSAPAALYWRAFALYRAGSTGDLRNALLALQAQRTRYPATADDSDAAALQVRINGALASRGDAQAAAAVRAANAQGTTCDREEMEVRAEALNALARQDEAAVGPVLGRVLAQRDECSVTLRRRAVYLLGRRSEPDVATRLLDVARDDPDRSVRSDAIAILGRKEGPETIRNLEQIFTSSSDERTQSAVLSALRSNDSPEASRLLRRYVERTDLSDNLRVSAVNTMTGGSGFVTTFGAGFAPTMTGSISGGGGNSVNLAPRHTTVEAVREPFVVGRVTAQAVREPFVVGRVTAETPRAAVGLPAEGMYRLGVESATGLSEEDAAFLRGVYARESSRQVKDAIISGLVRAGGPANDGWIMSIVRNTSEDSRYRSSALSRMRSERFPLSEIIRLYDDLTDRQLRSSVIGVLGARDEDAATDKLVEIIRNGTDPRSRTEAISALTRKKDPRSTQILLELIGK